MLRGFTGALAKNTRAGIALDGAQAGLARVRRQDGAPPSLAVRNLGAEGNWQDDAARHAGNLGLQRTPTSSVLSSGAYQLQLLEMPNVPRDELLAAVRWRLKDLINFPLEEAVVELLEMPAHSNPGAPHTAYAVVTRRDEVMQQIESMKGADLNMDVIDIPELCVRNVAIMLPQDKDGVAFLHLAEDCGYLTITRQGVLHLTRHLDAGRRALADASADDFALQEMINGIALEVQRSLDYYESHYDCRPITQIALGPGAHLDALPQGLAQNLGVNVEIVDFQDLFSLEGEVSTDVQGVCLLAVGAALRNDVAPRGMVAP
ncbi:MAG: type IV pilus biogenesis protein PilM [Woeseiaceae bacterium]